VKLDKTAPQLTLPQTIEATAASTAGAAATYTASATDALSGPASITPNCTPASGATFAPGTTTVTCSATDAAGNTKTGTFTVKVTYAWSGVLQPVNADGSSIFKANSTVPVKFQLTGASAGIANLEAKLYIAKVSNNIVGTEEEATSNAAADSGNVFRYDAASRQYVFNSGTRSLEVGTYQLRIDLGDGTTNTVTVSLR
jgi:hypothetical protein